MSNHHDSPKRPLWPFGHKSASRFIDTPEKESFFHTGSWRWPHWTALSLCLLGLLIVCFGSLRVWWSVLIPHDPRLFVASMALDQSKARQLYLESLDNLKNNNPQTALTGFDTLKSHYPGLAELILLHQAEADSQIPNEAAAQAALNELINRYPASPLVPKATYELGQSHIRAKEYAQARSLFTSLHNNLPNSPYGIGSLYYLGLLDLKDNPKNQSTLTLWRDYLAQCPDCVFSGDIASQMEALLPQDSGAAISQADQLLLGMAFLNSHHYWEKAIQHLNLASKTSAWIALGEAYAKSGHTPQARAIWLSGLGSHEIPVQYNSLKEATDGDAVPQSADDVAVDVINALLKLPGEPAAQTLKTLDNLKLEFGGDYVLWKLAQADSQNLGNYQQLLSRYPNSAYAPESSWNVLWSLLNTGHTDQFLSEAQAHIKNYPLARSTPKVLFWCARLQERTQPELAEKNFRQIIDTFPNTYYAFRAEARLGLLKNQKPDTGWQTDSLKVSLMANYPPNADAYDLKKLTILPPESQFIKTPLLAATGSGARAYRMAQELQAIGAGDDMLLVVGETLGKVPATVGSWSYHQLGDHPRALRLMRDNLLTRLKETKKPVIPTTNELKLLYPVYFQDVISEHATHKSIDPFLVQALMREESYFNAYAISSSNARGLMQLLPSTAADVAQWEGMVSNRAAFNPIQLFQPAVNVRLGSRYLQYLHQTFNGNSMPSVGAYNGGPGAMKRWISSSGAFTADPDYFVEQIPYEQSRDYIKKVFTSYWNYKRLYTASR